MKKLTTPQKTKRDSSHLHAGKIIQNAYVDLGVALEKTLLKKHKNMIKNARRQLDRLLNSGKTSACNARV